jgi:import inner membrane translocase subunit TIM10
MSFLFGGGRPQPSSAEKIAAAEAEIEMVSNMFNQYVLMRALRVKRAHVASI